MADMYRDTNDRYHHDAAFRASVDSLAALAREHGFTPGELKQIAFAAAFKLECEAKPMFFVARHGVVEPAPEVVGYLGDGTPVYSRTP